MIYVVCTYSIIPFIQYKITYNSKRKTDNIKPWNKEQHHITKEINQTFKKDTKTTEKNKTSLLAFSYTILQL